MSATATTRHFQDTRIDVKILLAALWTAMMFVFAYVDIFGFYRADVLVAAMHGKVANSTVTISQGFLVFTLGYILLPTLMLVLSLLLKPRANRIVNTVVSLLYVISIAVTCIGESHVYYLIGSTIEVILLAAIARSAWTWPTAPAARTLS